MWQDLGLNLIAEAIGIIVTVLGIDQLLKWRERRRWARIKRQVLARIRGIFSKLLVQLAVQINLYTDLRKGYSTIPKVDVIELMRSYPPEKLTAQVAGLDTSQWIGVAGFVQECLSEMQETTNTYNMLMEPELLTKLFSLEEIIQRVQGRISLLGHISRLARLSEERYQKDKEALIDQLAGWLVQLILTLLEMDAFLALQIECQDNASVV